MDHKTWLWRKKTSEKTIVETNGVDSSLIHHEEERYQTDQVELEKSVRDLSEHLASLLCDCNAKDDLVAINSKMAEEAIAGRERAEAEAMYLKQQLEEALGRQAETKERLLHYEAALKENMQKLNSVQEEQEKRIHDTIVKASVEFDKLQKELEDRLTETSKRVGELAVENRHLSKALLIKETLVEDLQKCQSQGAAEMNVLISRLDSTEKENAFLKYEFHILEKELEIRSEELEYSRRSADTLHKQHLEGLKKLAKLEAECLRLRLLLQKRLPCPAAVAKMKSEVEILGRDHLDLRRKRLNLTRDSSHKASSMENSYEIPIEKISFLVKRLSDMEEENRTLRQIITRKNTEFHPSRVSVTKSVCRSSSIEAQEHSGGQNFANLARSDHLSSEWSLMSGFDVGSEDPCSPVGSLADSLASELERLKTEKPKTQQDQAIVVPGMSLMDDYVEMERLALVTMDLPSRRDYHSSLTGKKLTPVVHHQLGFTDSKLEKMSTDVGTDRPFDWLQEVLNALLKQSRITKQSVAELLDDARIALGFINDPSASKVDKPELSKHVQEQNLLNISGYITWKCSKTSPIIASGNEATMMDAAGEVISNQNIQSDLRKSVPRIIKLIEQINPVSVTDCNTAAESAKKDHSAIQVESAATGDYFVRVFQWKASDLNAVLQQVVCTCNDLVNGKVDVDRFVKDLISSLEWIINNCAAVENASAERDKSKEQTTSSVASSYESSLLQMKSVQSDLQEENRKLKDAVKEMEREQNDVEARLKLSIDKNGALTLEVQKSEQCIEMLRKDLEALKESKGMMEDQIENQKLVNEDLDTQLAAAKARLNEALQKFSTIEVELEDRSNYCQELEAICLDLQLELESMTAKESPKNSLNQEKGLPKTGWEITETSVKFTESQDAIQNQENQLKSLTSPKEAAPLNNTATAGANIKHASLRDQLLAEENVNPEAFRSPKSVEMMITAGSQKPFLLPYEQSNALCAPNVLTHAPEIYLGPKHETSATGSEALAIVPSNKKQGRGGSGKEKLKRNLNRFLKV